MSVRYIRIAGRGLAASLVGVVLACGTGEADRQVDDGALAADQTATEAPPLATERRDTGVVSPPAGEDGVEPENGEPDPDRAVSDADRRQAADPASPGRETPAGVGAQPAGPAPAATAATEEILRATARTYERTRSLQAEFEQEMHNPLLGRTVRSSGTLYQRQPDRFLMRFSDPDGDVIVSDGQHFWIYYPSVDARQVIRAEGGPHGLDLHAQFIGDPVRRFTATPHGTEVVRGRSAHVMTLVPREPLGYRSLKVWIDTSDHLVRRFELTEENGNMRRFELHGVIVNPSLPDGLFDFTPPAGAQVVQR